MKNLTSLLVVSTLLLSVGCSKKSTSPIPAGHGEQTALESDSFFLNPQEIKLYNPTQANADKIKACAFARTAEDSCKLSEFPLLGMGKESVTIKDILNKTMSSNPAYIETFKEVLAELPPEVISMFGAVTAVVISDKINPSFYTYTSSSIYLSASYFWKTPEEKKKSTAKRDYREEFGQKLQFEDYSYYLDKNGNTDDASYSQKSRSISEIIPSLARLLIHELSHANDFFPKKFYQLDGINTDETLVESVDARWNQDAILSLQLKSDLSSSVLLKLGQILFHGVAPSETDLTITAQTVTREFREDGAAKLYAYSSAREDLATLVEGSLMYYFYNYSTYAVFVKFPIANFVAPDDFEYPIAGGVKNKIADPRVKERSLDVIAKIFSPAFSEKVSAKLNLLNPVDIPEDMNWDNLPKL
jgi:hypothetical protein